MTLSLYSQLAAGMAMVTAGSVVAMPAQTPEPSQPVAPHHIELTVVDLPLWPPLVPPEPPPISSPIAVDGGQVGSVSSLAVPIPPDVPAPVLDETNINQAIKNIYNAGEPWVRYGFELAAYAVGWVPWVGWLSPQVMIVYDFGERIVRSITFNVDDWLFGPLPFGEGLANVAQDSWDALVQLGIDEWNFWLPPLPPLPPLDSAAIETVSAEPDSTKVTETPRPVSDTAAPLDAPDEKSDAAAPIVEAVEEVAQDDEADLESPEEAEVPTAAAAADDIAGEGDEAALRHRPTGTKPGHRPAELRSAAVDGDPTDTPSTKTDEKVSDSADQRPGGRSIQD